jgi:hypothetical protein
LSRRQQPGKGGGGGVQLSCNAGATGRARAAQPASMPGACRRPRGLLSRLAQPATSPADTASATALLPCASYTSVSSRTSPCRLDSASLCHMTWGAGGGGGGGGGGAGGG